MLLNEVIILGVASDPEPKHAVWKRHAKCSIMEADADAAIATMVDELELKGWVTRVLLQQRIVSARKLLNLCGQGI